MTAKMKSMFDEIKQSLTTTNENTGGNGLYKEILKFKPGNTYQVRLVPNPQAPKESIFRHYTHGWISNATGKYVTAMCPTTFGDTCPIDAYYLKTYRSGTDSEKEASKVLSRKEGWFVNVYVISDPENPENEGKVKILRYGRELAKIIESAISGDDAKDFGVEKVFDVANGCTLRIKCENKTDKGRGKMQNMTTYVASRFLNASSLDLDEDDVQKIYDSVHDLKSVNKQTTPAEMQRLLDEHFFCLTTGSSEEVETHDFKTFSAPKQTNRPEPKTVVNHIVEDTSNEFSFNDTDESTDETLKKLLADL
jgi:hypothetical protein